MLLKKKITTPVVLYVHPHFHPLDLLIKRPDGLVLNWRRLHTKRISLVCTPNLCLSSMQRRCLLKIVLCMCLSVPHVGAYSKETKVSGAILGEDNVSVVTVLGLIRIDLNKALQCKHKQLAYNLTELQASGGWSCNGLTLGAALQA